jgi:hypothetical protein
LPPLAVVRRLSAVSTMPTTGMMTMTTTSVISRSVARLVLPHPNASHDQQSNPVSYSQAKSSDALAKPPKRQTRKPSQTSKYLSPKPSPRSSSISSQQLHHPLVAQSVVAQRELLKFTKKSNPWQFRSITRTLKHRRQPPLLRRPRRSVVPLVVGNARRLRRRRRL